MSYAKLHSGILASTIWDQPDHVRIIWITMLAMKDEHGVVQASIPGLARIARVSLENTEHAIGVLSGPDRYSRTKHDEGRRIEEVDGGWLVLNHDKYRELHSIEDARAKTAKRVRRYRERNNATHVTPKALQSVTERYSNDDALQTVTVTQVTPGNAIRSDHSISEQSRSDPRALSGTSRVRTRDPAPPEDGGARGFSDPNGEESGRTENVQHARANALVEGVSGQVQPPPGIAITTATILLEYVLGAQPNSAVAKQNENERENTLESWTQIICKMHVPGKREYAAMQAVMHWAFRSASWRLIVTDADVFRVQYNAIVAHKDRKKPSTNDAVSDTDLRKFMWPIEQRLTEAREEVAAAVGLPEPLHEHPTSEDKLDAMARLRESGADPMRHFEHVLAVAIAEARAERSIDFLGWCLFRPKAWAAKVRKNPATAGRAPAAKGAAPPPDPAAERAREARQRAENQRVRAEDHARAQAAARDRDEVQRIARETAAAMNGRSRAPIAVDDDAEPSEDAADEHA